MRNDAGSRFAVVDGWTRPRFGKCNQCSIHKFPRELIMPRLSFFSTPMRVGFPKSNIIL